MKKSYAVRIGRQTGIFENWDECKKQVIGFSGAEYKSFLNREDAEIYLNSANQGDSSSDISKSGYVGGAVPCCVSTPSGEWGRTHAIAYVDGSYNAKTKEFSFGAVILHNGEELHFKEKFDDEELAAMRNVAGEIKGAEFAMHYCIENGIESVDIYYDYEGISKWPSGSWKANKEGTIRYKQFYDEAKKAININFVKVKGHSGDKYNDLADALAKEALGIDH